VYKPLTELEAKIIVPWLQLLYKLYMRRLQLLFMQCLPDYNLRDACFSCCLTIANQWINICSTYHFILILHITSAIVSVCMRHEYTCFPHLSVCDCRHAPFGFPLIWLLGWYFLDGALAFPSWKRYMKCISPYSTLIKHDILFPCYHYFATWSNVSHKQMYE
jgi:hypothetical protein